MPTMPGYEAIPDVETGLVHQALVLKPCDLYPEANTEEAELLGTLDSIINGSSLELSIPTVDPDDVSPRSPSIGMALVWPSLSDMVLSVAAFSSVRSEAGGGVLDPSKIVSLLRCISNVAEFCSIYQQSNDWPSILGLCFRGLNRT